MNAVITIDPARQGGAPCVGDTRITVDAVVASAIYDGVPRACEAFGLSAREVRLACAWWALDGNQAPVMPIPKGWERWARRAWRNHADPTDPPEVWL